MPTAHPDSHSPDRMVKVQVLQTVDQVNARGPMTAEAFQIFAAQNGRCELIEGSVRMMSPAGSEHGYVAAEILLRLGSHVRQHKLGRVYAAETGFVIQRSPDTVRAPDVAFICKDRLPERESRGFGTIMPDLVVEVISPSDNEQEIDGKTNAWLAAGIRCVMNVYPTTQSASVYRSQDEVIHYEADDVVDLSDVVDGWRPPLKAFFGIED